jgi:hypothetical protein
MRAICSEPGSRILWKWRNWGAPSRVLCGWMKTWLKPSVWRMIWGTHLGHAGQDALNECMKPHGGFEHNLQSLRVVDRLEERYPAFDGLNLTFETREGILKHCSLSNAQLLNARSPAAWLGVFWMALSLLWRLSYAIWRMRLPITPMMWTTAFDRA